MFSKEQKRNAAKVAKKAGLYGLIGVLAAGLFATLLFVGVGLLARKIADDNNAAKAQQSQQATQNPDPVPTDTPAPETSSSAEPSEDAALTSKVIRIIDGDTIVVESTDQLPDNGDTPGEHIVRMLGINAPEMNFRSAKDAECGAEEATRSIQVVVRPGNEVELVHDERSDQTDRYGRTLAYVMNSDGTDVGAWMVERGYAMPYYPKSEPEPERVPDYQQLAQEAQAQHKGSHAYCTLK